MNPHVARLAVASLAGVALMSDKTGPQKMYKFGETQPLSHEERDRRNAEKKRAKASKKRNRAK